MTRSAHLETSEVYGSVCLRPDLAVGMQARMEEARALFRNPDTTEFVIVTIPTVMAAAESARLAKALRTEKVPVKSILINQV